MATLRQATTRWEGSLRDGQGSVELTSSAAGRFEVTWASRAESPNGRTSPEELIAGAHSACFAMALSNELTKAGNPPRVLETSAEVGFEAGVGITGIRLRVQGAVPGMEPAEFQAAAENAKANCPVSKALAAVNIDLDAKLL